MDTQTKASAWNKQRFASTSLSYYTLLYCSIYIDRNNYCCSEYDNSLFPKTMCVGMVLRLCDYYNSSEKFSKYFDMVEPLAENRI